MATLIKEAGDEFLRSKLMKGGKNRPLPEHTTRVFLNFTKEKRIASFEGSENFNLITFEPLKIEGFRVVLVWVDRPKLGVLSCMPLITANSNINDMLIYRCWA